MKILITGGFGFLGGRIASYLSDRGHSVILSSRKERSPPEWLPSAQVKSLLWECSYSLSEICQGVEVVIHAAGMNSQDCIADPIAALNFNGIASARLAEAAGAAGVKKFYYLSTAHVYSSPLTGTITEKNCALNLHPYASSHFAGEQSIQSAAKKWGMNATVLRLTNVIGAPEDKGANCWMLIANDFCKSVAEHKKISLNTNGEECRDFIGISEVCRIINQLINIKASDVISNVLNLGSGNTMKTKHLALLVQERSCALLGYRPEITYGEKTPIISEFKYVNECLHNLGITASHKLEYEIDMLLAFTKKNFTPLNE